MDALNADLVWFGFLGFFGCSTVFWWHYAYAVSARIAVFFFPLFFPIACLVVRACVRAWVDSMGCRLNQLVPRELGPVSVVVVYYSSTIQYAHDGKYNPHRLRPRLGAQIAMITAV